jgi:hypothetical protein
MDRITGRLTGEGYELRGNKFNIPARDMSKLYFAWLERAYRVAAKKAFRTVYNDAPSVSKADRSLSLRSRKLKAFSEFARFLYIERMRGNLPVEKMPGQGAFAPLLESISPRPQLRASRQTRQAP